MMDSGSGVRKMVTINEDCPYDFSQCKPRDVRKVRSRVPVQHHAVETAGHDAEECQPATSAAGTPCQIFMCHPDIGNAYCELLISIGHYGLHIGPNDRKIICLSDIDQTSGMLTEHDDCVLEVKDVQFEDCMMPITLCSCS